MTKEAGEVTDGWMEATEGFLGRAIDFFGADRLVASIRPKDMKDFVRCLSTVQTNRGRPLQAGSIRHHLNALSRLYRRGRELEVVSVGYNPVAELLEKPKKGDYDASYLEVHDAALLLERARELSAPTNNSHAVASTYAHALLATFLLTGGRCKEVLGLELQDVSFDRETVTFRPNRWRRLKTRRSSRTLTLWPQLREILEPYIFEQRVRQPGTLLFPSFRTGGEAMLTDVRKLLDRVAARAGLLEPLVDSESGGQSRGEARGHTRKGGHAVRTRMFRHTYCSARLQTLDGGRPVAEYTVASELGHGSEDMIRKVYAHLGLIRHRSDVVEYRLDARLRLLVTAPKVAELALI